MVSIDIHLDVTDLTKQQIRDRLDIVEEFRKQTIVRPVPTEGYVKLSDERWDHVIHSLEENIDQLYGPSFVEPTEKQVEENIEPLEKTLELIMEQVTADD